MVQGQGGGGGGDAVVVEENDETASPSSGEPEQKIVTRNSLVELQCIHRPKNNTKTTVEHY